MNNSTFPQWRKIMMVVLSALFFFFISICAKAQAVYTTAFGDWTQSWNTNSGYYQATGGPGLFSFGAGNITNGQVNTRLLTSDGTTTGAQQPLRVGQKFIIRVTAPDGGGRSVIENGGRIGFSLRNTNDLFDGNGSGYGRYNSNALLRVEFQGGQSTAQLVDGNGTTQSGMPGFNSFVAGITYEVEMISDREFNLQVVGGTRYNIHSMVSAGTVKEVSIANLGANKDGVFTLVEVQNTPTVSVVANAAEFFTVTGIVSDNGATANSLTKTGLGTVTLTGLNTYTGLTTVNNGTLRLNAASANTINVGNNITLASGGTLQVSQDQTVGNLTVPAGSTLLVDAGKTLTVTGSFTGGGTISNNGTIVLSSGSPQSFPGSGTISAMNNLTIDNNNTSGVTLDCATLTVTGTLNFVQHLGIRSLFTTGSNVLTANNITGAGAANGWVNGNLQKNITAAGLMVFEVGDANVYTPASLNFSPNSLTAGNILVSTRAPISSATGFASLSLTTSQCINRVWSVTKPAGSTFTGSYTGTFTYDAGDLQGSPVVSALRTGSYNGSMWYYQGTVIAGPSQVTVPMGMIPTATYDILFATARPVTISGVTVTPKLYDAGISATLNFGSATINGIVNNNFVNIDASTATGSYNDKHVGNGKPVSVTGVALSGPGLDAGAYLLSAQPSATGNITARPLTITAVSNTKPYDGNITAAGIPVISPAGPTGLQGSDIANFSETYDTKQAGNNKVLTPAGTVTDGNNGNNYSYSFATNNTGVITNIPIINLSATPGTISCSGGTTTVTVGATGGDGSLQYSLTGTANFAYQASTLFTNVAAGTYTLTVKDEDNFTNQLAGIVISQPAGLTASYTYTNISACNAGNDGTITVTPAGGSGNYNYAWTGVTGSGNPATTPYPNPGNVSSLTGLPIGFYNVTITDVGGCGQVIITNIHIGYAFTVYVTNSGSSSSSCGNTGTVVLYGNAGVQPYTYSLTAAAGPYQASNTFTGLAAGTYTAYVKDAAGCVGTKSVTVSAAAAIVVSPFARGASSCAPDGSIEVYKTGGIPPFTYSKDGINYQASNVFSGLAAGPYTVYAKDAAGCIGQANTTVAAGVGLSATISKVNTSTCLDDGSIQVNASGGVGPYTYSKDNGVNYQASNAFGGLGQGNYAIKVKDSKGCTSGTINVTINLNTIVVTSSVVNATSCVSNNGQVQLFRTGGYGPYTYSLDGNTYQPGNIFNGVAAGTYTGFVKDSKTCIGIISNIVVGPGGCGRNNITAAAAVATKVPAFTEPALEIQVYPNPTATSFVLKLPGFGNDEVTIRITDIMGRVVYHAESIGNREFIFGNNFTAGIYNVQVAQGTKSLYTRLVKE